MTGEEIYNNLISKRDYSGSEADEYAQLLSSIYIELCLSGELEQFLILLQDAHAKGLKIAVKAPPGDLVGTEITFDDLIIENL